MSTPAPAPAPSAALQLAGRLLKGRWQVDSLVTFPPGATGGRNSVCYIVTDTTTGKTAFLKAIDYTKAFALAAAAGTMVASVIVELAGRFKFEQELLELCRDNSMRHVVVILDAGVELVPWNTIPNVDFIIFEHADATVRNRVIDSSLALTEILLVCRQSAVALQELHRRGIFHQDVKPSNLLLFPSQKLPAKNKPGTHLKLGDLGRASHQGKVGPYDTWAAPGDSLYMPFDLFYNGAVAMSADRRMVDGYSLGCVFFNLVTGHAYNQLMATHLQPHHTPPILQGQWTAPYAEAKAYVDAAHAGAMVIFHDALMKLQAPEGFIDEVVAVLEQLLDTDPDKRGHPRNKKAGVSPCDMERYVSEFNHLVNRAFIWGL